MMAGERRVDVSDLEPPEPMQVTLAELRQLEAGEYLVMCHRREPVPLFAMILEMGYCYRVRSGSVTPFEIVIWAAGNVDLDQVCGPADATPNHPRRNVP